MTTPLYGYYSEDQAKVCGTVLYFRPDGTEVEVTSVSRSPTDSGTAWKNMVSIGEVTAFSRDGRFNPGRSLE